MSRSGIKLLLLRELPGLLVFCGMVLGVLFVKL